MQKDQIHFHIHPVVVHLEHSHSFIDSLDNHSRTCSGLCRMKMFPVMILAKYHLSARSAVSEHRNSSARLVFPMFPVERATRFPNVPSRARDSFSQCSQSSLRLAFECSNPSTQFEVCVFGWFFFTIIISFCHSMPFIKFMST